MRKGEKTRDSILHEAMVLFNTKGYGNTSISDVMQVTGLKKGGIYNHFDSKQELACAAFDYAFSLVRQRIRNAIAKQTHAGGRLESIISVFQDFIDAPPIPGGCPILNAAIETDDAHSDPELREKVRAAMNRCRKMIRDTVKLGIDEGQIKPTANPTKIATVVLATLEGAIMLSKLNQDPSFMDDVIQHLKEYFAELAC
jgi:AcrR family transcriptional regulator